MATIVFKLTSIIFTMILYGINNITLNFINNKLMRFKHVNIPKGLVEFLVITFLGLSIAFFFCPRCFFNFFDFDTNNWKIIVISIAYTYGLGYGCSFIMPRLSRSKYYRNRPVLKFIINLVILAVFTFVGAVLIFYIMAHLLFDNADEWLNLATLANNAKVAMWIALAISLFFNSLEFLANYKREAIRAEKLEKEKIVAQYEFLKNQVNPHFLFNSLNALNSLIYENQDLAAKYVNQLSLVYRYVLESKNKDLVPLGEELEFLNAYVFLLKIRFEDNLRINIELNGSDQLLIVPLSLQILIENAVKHNEISDEYPLTINIFEKDGIIVENPVQSKSTLDKGMGVGLKNLTERYQLFSSKPLRIIRSEKYFKVEIPELRSELST